MSKIVDIRISDERYTEIWFDSPKGVWLLVDWDTNPTIFKYTYQNNILTLKTQGNALYKAFMSQAAAAEHLKLPKEWYRTDSQGDANFEKDAKNWKLST